MVSREATSKYHRPACACPECKERRFQEYKLHGIPGGVRRIGSPHTKSRPVVVQILFCFLLILSVAALVAAVWAIGQDKGIAQSAQWWYLPR